MAGIQYPEVIAIRDGNLPLLQWIWGKSRVAQTDLRSCLRAAILYGHSHVLWWLLAEHAICNETIRAALVAAAGQGHMTALHIMQEARPDCSVVKLAMQGVAQRSTAYCPACSGWPSSGPQTRGQKASSRPQPRPGICTSSNGCAAKTA